MNDMENVETKPFNKLIIQKDGDEYVFEGSGQPGVDSIGTEEIRNGSIEEEDLNDEVKDRMTVTHDSTTGGLRIGGYAKPGEVPADNGSDDI